MHLRRPYRLFPWRVPLLIITFILSLLFFFYSILPKNYFSTPPLPKPLLPRTDDERRHKKIVDDDTATWSHWENIAHRSLPATVRIVVSKHLGIDALMPDRAHIVTMYGSGFIFKNESGEYRVMSAAHIVAEFAQKSSLASIEALTYEDRPPLELELIGFDVTHDVSLFRFKDPKQARGLPTLPLGTSSTLNVGERVMTIGHPISQEWAVTFGCVSKPNVAGDGINAKFGRIIAHTSKTNYGNSGGPIINHQGEVVGINILIFPLPHGSGARALMNDFFGGAIPIDDIMTVMPYLEKSEGKEVRHLSLDIGLKQSNQMATSELFNLDIIRPATSGVIVFEREHATRKMKFFQRGDIIVSCNDTPIRNPLDVWKFVNREPLGTGKTLVFVVIRDGKEVTIKITL